MGNISIEQMIQLINKNQNLDGNLKYQLGKSLIEYVAINREVKLENYKENFLNLEVERTHSLVNKVENYCFIPTTKKMIINERYMARNDINLENVYMQMTLDLLFSNGKISGFGEEGLQALNIGFKQTLATKLMGEEKKEIFSSDEYIYTQLIGRIIGVDILMEAYHTNNPSLVKEALEKYQLSKINELAEYNISRNNENRNSELARIQVQLFRYCELHHIDTDDLITNMVFNSVIFEERKKYASIDNMHKIIPIKMNIGNLEKSL